MTSKDKGSPLRGIMLPLLILAFLASCAPVRPNLGDPVREDFAHQLLRHWQDVSGQVTSVQGFASVDIQTPMKDINGTQVLLAKMPYHLRAETLSPFGVPLVTLAVKGDRLGVFLPADNLYYLGAASPENLGAFVNIPLEPADLVSIILYQPALLDSWKEEAFTLDDGGWVLIRYGTKTRQELVFSAEKQLVEVTYFESNDLKFRVNYAELNEATPSFPAVITLELPEKHARINLRFTDYETNGRIKDGLFELQPAAGAKVVYLPN